MLGPLPKRAERWSNAYLTVTCLVPVLLIVFLLGSLALTGGQVSPSGSPKWEAPFRHPLFPLPLIACLTIAGASAALSIVQFAIRTELPSRVWMGYFRVNLAAAVATVAMAFLAPDHSASGEPSPSATGLATIGDQWIAAIPFLALTVVVVIVSFVKEVHERKLAPPRAPEADPGFQRTRLLGSTPPRDQRRRHR
ncbi:hypothetical protein DFO66_11462 [Brevibacterium sanguinis]|uniref:Uncharacterized protein n=2 Tax=Brevibacterium TaxID=1696 RepID=A0A366IGW9_9MICO|nr:hypothetical protein DFO66_11462 [Brevibacterium sanguinis]RBP69218.1 hypothetical protein DFO65_11462 [Brevibacterium celere]